MIIKIIGNLQNLEEVNFFIFLEQYYNKENENREIFGIVKYFSESTSKTCRHLVIFDNEEEYIKCKNNQYFRKLLSNYKFK